MAFESQGGTYYWDTNILDSEMYMGFIKDKFILYHLWICVWGEKG